MEGENELLQEVQGLREQLAKLAEASMRINESLDYDIVLQGVVDSACFLTDARFGGMSVLDESGHFEKSFFHGFGLDELEQLQELPDGPQLFRSFISIQKTLRHGDLGGYAASEGLSIGEVPLHKFIVAPMFHRGLHVGSFFLANKEEADEFTGEDEGVATMFASQAALVISNARQYRDSVRARSDLETLIDTSPVGVAVFDAKTGEPVSFNREAARILDVLRTQEKSLEHLLEVLTIRRADGREVSLDVVSMTQALSGGETVRAEEVTFHVPDGRSVTALLNATPIRAEEGEIESFVVTLQDMTPLEEQERLRAEFLATVSHELRAPLATIRGSVSTLLDESSAVHPSATHQFLRIILEQAERMHLLITDLLDMALLETGELPVSLEPTDLDALIREAADAFRIAGHRHDLVIETEPDLPRIMADTPRIIQVLGNLLSNAARHSLESTTIRVRAVRGDFYVTVSVSDEGIGIPAESLPLLFRKFSRLGREQGEATGLGLAICKGIVEAHGGRIWAVSGGSDAGASFVFTIPTAEETRVTTPSQVARPNAGSPREGVRVLVVDDDHQALRYICDVLAKASYRPVATGDPEDVPRLMEEEKPQIVLLDLMLPGIDGVRLMREIMLLDDVPVIFVSAYGQDMLVAKAFEMGADDYVVKPFSPTELVARVKAALRRRATPEPSLPYVLRDLTIDYSERRVRLRGNPVDLTAMQYQLLVELSVNAGRVLTYEQLLRRVWHSETNDVRTMRTTISTIRRKLGDEADDPTYIFTEFGVGYKMPVAETLGPEPPTTT